MGRRPPVLGHLSHTDWYTRPTCRCKPRTDPTAWMEGLQSLGSDQPWTSDDCARRTTMLQQLIMAREDSQELPDTLNLTEGYDHLSDEQRHLLKETLCSEATFFMKGKYPKIIRTNNPVVIDTVRPHHVNLDTDALARKNNWSSMNTWRS